MAVSKQDIVIVGCGPGGEEYVSPAARAAANAAEALVGAGRLLAMFPGAGGQRVPWSGSSEGMLDEIASLHEAGKRLAVLVSGDPGLFSFGQSVVRRFGRGACRIIPAVSSVQVAFSRLGLDWSGAKILSAHGRLPEETAAELAGSDRIAVLAGTAEALAWCGRMAQELARTHAAFVCEELTLAGERVRRMDAASVASCGAGSLAIVLLIRNEMLI